MTELKSGEGHPGPETSRTPHDAAKMVLEESYLNKLRIGILPIITFLFGAFLIENPPSLKGVMTYAIYSLSLFSSIAFTKAFEEAVDRNFKKSGVSFVAGMMSFLSLEVILKHPTLINQYFPDLTRPTPFNSLIGILATLTIAGASVLWLTLDSNSPNTPEKSRNP